MRFFTPELWLAFQGSRRDAAFKAWDRRFALYRKTLDKILPKLNASARPFFRDALILHDATLTRMEIGDRIDDAESALTWRDIVNRRKLRVRLFVLADTFHRGRPVKNYWYVLEYKKVEFSRQN